ncbi:isoprenyl transferase [Sphingobium sp. H39-3-25]|uniref:isoprenyl transferase n=1 Tax=Sphingobium arseniciresistens TaxID=3030834 RepID=UPI0023B9E3C2|nr:isoprenyl transferase [Sphingobium arseniciresistens]
MATQAQTEYPQHAAEHGARHVAIIMDGNGRWAKRRFLPRIAGHKAGVDAVRAISRSARQMGVECLTLYAFSSENWKRPESEVMDLMGLLRRFIQSDIDEFDANNVRLKVIGNYRALEPSLVALIDGAIARTAGNSGATLAIALNYGAQDEMVRAVRAVAARVANGEIAPADIDVTAIDAELDTADLPPLDLLIRTSGEQRLSNFLLWQAAYAELYFTDRLWPDFDAAALAEALAAFKGRDRRYGGL